MDTCTDIARAHAEPLAGTAPVARGWLLIEQPGSWGRDALTASDLDPAIGAAVAERLEGLPARAGLVRRPGGGTRREGKRAVLLAHTGATPWCEVLELDHDRSLLQLDPEVTTRPQPPGLGAALEGPLILVCTHGRRDRCCAELGRPIAQMLSVLHGDAVWETSHIGGHRFAGNVVILPDGLVYGGLDVTRAAEVVARHLDGHLDLDHLRGRTGTDRAVQAAEVLVRQKLGLDAAGALRPYAVDVTAEGTIVTLATATERFEARVAAAPTGATRALSCGDDPEDPTVWTLLELRQVR